MKAKLKFVQNWNKAFVGVAFSRKMLLIGVYFRNKPEWDFPPLSPAIQLASACRDLEVAKKKLEGKLCEMKERRNQMDKRWEKLQEKEQQLRESFIRFNKSVQVGCYFLKILP
jgi:hypothetical protein